MFTVTNRQRTSSPRVSTRSSTFGRTRRETSKRSGSIEPSRLRGRNLFSAADTICDTLRPPSRPFFICPLGSPPLGSFGSTALRCAVPDTDPVPVALGFRDGAEYECIPPMNELDLPCSDCGTALVERTVHARDVSISADWRDHVQVAACPSCGARYYPESALVELSKQSNTQHGGVER